MHPCHLEPYQAMPAPLQSQALPSANKPFRPPEMMDTSVAGGWSPLLSAIKILRKEPATAEQMFWQIEESGPVHSQPQATIGRAVALCAQGITKSREAVSLLLALKEAYPKEMFLEEQLSTVNNLDLALTYVYTKAAEPGKAGQLLLALVAVQRYRAGLPVEHPATGLPFPCEDQDLNQMLLDSWRHSSQQARVEAVTGALQADNGTSTTSPYSTVWSKRMEVLLFSAEKEHRQAASLLRRQKNAKPARKEAQLQSAILVTVRQLQMAGLHREALRHLESSILEYCYNPSVCGAGDAVLREMQATGQYEIDRTRIRLWQTVGEPDKAAILLTHCINYYEYNLGFVFMRLMAYCHRQQWSHFDSAMERVDDCPEIAVAKSIRHAMEAESLERQNQLYSAKECYRFARGYAKEALKQFSGSHIVLQHWRYLCDQFENSCVAASNTESEPMP